VENPRTVDSTHQEYHGEADTTDSRPDCPAVSRRTFLPPIASFLAAAIGLAVVLAQEAFGPERFDLLVAASVILSVGMLGFAFAALGRARFLQPPQQSESRTTVDQPELEDMAVRDDLTNLPNRRYFYGRLHGELELARSFRRHLAVLVLGIDGFKGINDRYGHQAGDVVLAHVGKQLLETLRGSDVPARIGGDEFAVIMPATDEDGAFTVAERLQEALRGTLVVNEDGAQVNLHVSLGVSGYPWAGDNVAAMVQHADTQMREAKAMHKHSPV
jgi:diguanylate cyclase (GGDEF)-like protein